MFLVPRGNTYYLENISQRPAKLFFAQARKVVEEDAHDAIRVGAPGSARKGSVNPASQRDRGKERVGSTARSPSVNTQTPAKLKPAKR